MKIKNYIDFLHHKSFENVDWTRDKSLHSDVKNQLPPSHLEKKYGEITFKNIEEWLNLSLKYDNSDLLNYITIQSLTEVNDEEKMLNFAKNAFKLEAYKCLDLFVDYYGVSYMICESFCNKRGLDYITYLIDNYILTNLKTYKETLNYCICFALGYDYEFFRNNHDSDYVVFEPDTIGLEIILNLGAVLSTPVLKKLKVMQKHTNEYNYYDIIFTAINKVFYEDYDKIQNIIKQCDIAYLLPLVPSWFKEKYDWIFEIITYSKNENLNEEVQPRKNTTDAHIIKLLKNKVPYEKILKNNWPITIMNILIRNEEVELAKEILELIDSRPIINKVEWKWDDVSMSNFLTYAHKIGSSDKMIDMLVDNVANNEDLESCLEIFKMCVVNECLPIFEKVYDKYPIDTSWLVSKIFFAIIDYDKLNLEYAGKCMDWVLTHGTVYMGDDIQNLVDTYIMEKTRTRAQIAINILYESLDRCFENQDFKIGEFFVDNIEEAKKFAPKWFLDKYEWILDVMLYKK